MNSKRKIFFVLTAVSVVFACLFALCGCGGKKEYDAPKNLRVSTDNYLEWDKVDGAELYIVEIDGQDYAETDALQIDVLIPLLSKAGKHTLRVKACGSKLKDSAWAAVEHEKKVSYDSLAFYYNDDGKTLTVAAGSKSKVSGDIVIPSEYMIDGKKYLVTDIAKNGFSDCDKLTTAVILSSHIKQIPSGAFADCTALERVEMNNGVTEISGDAFKNCVKLEKIRLPDSLTDIKTGAFAFAGLKKIRIPKSVKSIERWAFYFCRDIAEITAADDNAYFRAENDCLIGKSTNGVVLGCKNSVIPEDVVAIEEAAFGYSKLESITIPSGVVKIESSAFMGCNYMKEIAFNDGLTTIDVEAFSDCSVLKGVSFPATLQALDCTAFTYCKSLQSISVADGNTVFKSENNCVIRRDGTVVLGCKTSVIPDDVKKIGENAFFSVDMESIELPSGLTDIGASAFERSSLRSVTIPRGVKTIGGYAFYKTPLEEVFIPDSVTYIGKDAFFDTKLKCAVLPDSVRLLPYDKSMPNDIFNSTTVYTVMDKVPQRSNFANDNVIAFYCCCCFLSCELACDKDGYPYVVSFVYKGSELPWGYGSNIEYNMQSLGNEPGVPTRLGYVFKGWATDSDSGDVKYPTKTTEDGRLTAFTLAERKTITSETKLYAVWEKA